MRLRLRTRSWYIGVILLSAIIVAVESIVVEGALRIAFIDVFTVCAIPSIVGGLILIGFNPRPTIQFTKDMTRREWFFLFLLSIIAAIGVFLWYDAVGRIGAGKEAILGGGSSEVLFVVLLSAVFLSERLNKWEILGSILVLVGVFIVLVRSDSLNLSLGIGEIEAIGSSFLLASSVVMAAKLLRVHNVAPFSGIELIISGLVLLFIGISLGAVIPSDATSWFILLFLGIFPAIGIYTYFVGLKGIGASITSILFALTGIMTVALQILIIAIIPDADVLLPENIALALIGGIIAFIGVYLIHRNPSPIIPPIGGHKI